MEPARTTTNGSRLKPLRRASFFASVVAICFVGQNMSKSEQTSLRPARRIVKKHRKYVGDDCVSTGSPEERHLRVDKDPTVRKKRRASLATKGRQRGSLCIHKSQKLYKPCSSAKATCLN